MSSVWATGDEVQAVSIGFQMMGLVYFAIKDDGSFVRTGNASQHDGRNDRNDGRKRYCYRRGVFSRMGWGWGIVEASLRFAGGKGFFWNLGCLKASLNGKKRHHGPFLFFLFFIFFGWFF